MLGLKALAEGLLTTLPQALRHYERGFRAVWDEDSFGSAHFRDPSFHRVERAADEFANGHGLLVAALLTLLLAYVGRGAVGRAQALQDIAHNPRLGPRMAQWLEENESRLARHPGLQPRPAASMQAQAAETQPTKPLSSGTTPRADHLDTAAMGMVTTWNPLTGPGPLGEKVAATFRGSTYSEVVTTETTTLYRVHGGTARELDRTGPSRRLRVLCSQPLIVHSIPPGATPLQGSFESMFPRERESLKA